MKTYCVKCRKDNENLKQIKTKSNRLIKNSRFLKE